MNTTTTAATIVDEIRATAVERIATCNMYVNRRAIVAHNWVIVSGMTNGRIVFTMNNDMGERCMAVGMQTMPTCFAQHDAERLAAEFNAEFDAAGTGEHLTVMLARDWWTIERDAAQSVVDSIDNARGA